MKTKQKLALLICLNLAFVAILAGFLYQKQKTIEETLVERQESREDAFFLLLENIDILNQGLIKAQHARCVPVLNALGNQMFRGAVLANVALDSLDFSEEEAQNARKILDFLEYFSRQMAKSIGLEDSPLPRENASLESIQQSLARFLADLRQLEAKAILAPLSPNLDLEERFAEAVAVMAPISASTAAYPPIIPLDQAKAQAGALLGLRPEIFSLGDSVAGAYQLEARVDGGRIEVHVCWQGAGILQVGTNRPVHRASISKEEGLSIARGLLQQKGYEQMELFTWQLEGNILKADFIPLVEETWLLPGLVHIQIALDNGRLFAFYPGKAVLDIAITGPGIEAARAKEAVPGDLFISSVRQAVIENRGREVFVFLIQAQEEGGQGFLFFIDAQTGRQLEIGKIRENDAGFWLF